MESQGLSQGSLRNSHRETHAIQRKPASANLQELASKLLERCFKDLILRQRLDLERAEPILKRAPFFVLENDSRAEAGFLVFLPGKPALYMQQRRTRDGAKRWNGYTLRMRVSSTITEGGGTVLIARLDDVLHCLQLEDVWLWKGSNLFETRSFTERRDALREFVERHWIPDARLLGGIFTKVATFLSLETFSEQKDWTEYHSLEFIPDTPGKRRFYLNLEERINAAEGPAAMKQHRGAVVERSTQLVAFQEEQLSTPVAAPTPQTPEPSATRKARAVPVDKMPDVYDLYGEDGLPISRASVQQFSVSQVLRGVVQAKKEAWVTAKWRKEFGGYEIIAVL